VRKEKHLDEEAEEGEEIIYKIEIPANRHASILSIRILIVEMCIKPGVCEKAQENFHINNMFSYPNLI
jgi:hypothetical protein